MRHAIRVIVLLALAVAVFCPASRADDAKCGLADKIAAEAAKAGDTANALKLFIKAQEMCPSQARHNYNLGLAYMNYGDPGRAEQYFAKAVEQDAGAATLNALAYAMLRNGSDPAKALDHARRAVKSGGGPGAHDTLVRALMANARHDDAMEAAGQAVKKWPSDKQIAKAAGEAEDAAVSHYLGLGQGGKVQEAIAGLQGMGGSPRAMEGLCWLLHKSGKTAEAMTLARSASGTFPSHKPLQDAYGDISDDFIRAAYLAFQQGDRAGAVASVDKMRSRFRDDAALEKAYREMFGAVLADTATIDVPRPRQAASTGGGGRAEGMLDSLRSGGSVGEVGSLMADVDSDIPTGRDKRPDAVAVVIGNKNYSRFGNGIADVKFADRDAAYMKEYLVKAFGYSPENIIYVKDATQGMLSQIFGTSGNPSGKLSNYVKPGKSEVFIYYSGHGAPDLSKGQAFIVPVDADVSYIANNGYAMEVFYDNLSRLPARSVTVVVDACFSGNYAEGALVRDVSPALLKASSPVRRMDNAVVISSTGQGQVSHWYPEMGHGLFTYYFMKGLSGDADKDGDKGITVAEMRDYLKDKVPYGARRLAGGEQTPVVVSGLGDEAVLVRLR